MVYIVYKACMVEEYRRSVLFCSRLIQVKHTLPPQPSESVACYHRVPTPSPYLYARGSRYKFFDEEITPLLPHSGIGERFSQTISNLGHAALLRRCELPLETKVLN